MQLPLRAIHPLADVARTFSPAYLQHALGASLFTVSEVPDIIGLPCAVDITINDGFYITVLLYLATRAAIRGALALARRTQTGDE